MRMVDKLGALVQLLFEDDENLLGEAEAECENWFLSEGLTFNDVILETELPVIDLPTLDDYLPIDQSWSSDSLETAIADNDDDNNKPSSDAPLPGRRKRRPKAGLTLKKKVHAAKQARNRGEAYNTFSGRLVPARTLRQPCTALCRLQCSERFSPQERKSLFQEFWSIADHKGQWEFIAKNLDILPKGTCTSDKGDESRRSASRRYYFWVGQDKRQVCKTYFLNTLAISNAWIGTVCKKLADHGCVNEDGRGRIGNRKKA
ncbi:hypothetical protein TSAR_001921 [Trichomalopsis sarcophagae]|uniref:Uncharacterized protein n=1 Tax=Trichomalopsis sarcophagae TaxID=543379 RepID=A0A232FK09_9HYME|nr:hypothetical protein TSAR_001921 [Trichomalopsis sarcophagae]